MICVSPGTARAWLAAGLSVTVKYKTPYGWMCRVGGPR